jgi:hypothetical protein
MKTLLPLTSATLVAVLFLSGCTDPKAPKAPPKVPEPKAVTLVVPASLHALPLNDRVPA